MAGKGRNYAMDRKAIQTGITDIIGKLTVGTSGAVSAYDMPGVATFVRTSAGKYTLTLDSEYAEFAGLFISELKTTLGGVSFQVYSETVASTKIVILDCFNSTGAITDLSTTIIYLHMLVRTSTKGV